MQTQVNKRFSRGFQFGLSWTWSRALTLVNGNGEAVNPFLDYRVRNYGPASFDRTHNLVVNYIYSLPKLGKVLNNVVARKVFDDWDLAGVTTFTSGAPLGIGYALSSGMDIIGGSGAGVDSRVNLTGNPVLPKGERTIYRHFNTDVVQPPTRPSSVLAQPPSIPSAGLGSTSSTFRFTRTSPYRRTSNDGCNSGLSSTISSITPASRTWTPLRDLIRPESRLTVRSEHTRQPWTRAVS